METEIWKPVKGLADLYQVSNLGHVKRLQFHDLDGYTRKEREIRPAYLNSKSGPSARAYVRLVGIDSARHVQVCQLVAEAFMPGFNPEIYDIQFLDFNEANSALHNLRAVPKLITAFNRRISKITRPKETSAMSIDSAPQSSRRTNAYTHRT